MLLTASLTFTAPVLPPTTRITGLSVLKPQSLQAFSLFPDSSSFLIGEPVRTAFFSGRYFNVSGKLQHILSAPLMAILLARPGVMSDSWIITGILLWEAANTTGTDTNPPLENTISGFNFFINFLA